MTNKHKKTSYNKRKQQEAAAKNKAGSISNGFEKQPVIAAGPDLPTSKDEPVQYTRAQLTGVVFLALGASRFLEWQRALSEMIIAASTAEGNNNNTTTTNATICQDYIMTNDEVDYDSVCDSPVTLTMMSIKYDLSIQMMLLVLFLMIQCWKDEIMLSRLNAFLTVTPVSTCLLLLQSCSAWITPRRSKLMTIANGILMFLSLPATQYVLREFRESSANNKKGILSISSGIVIPLSLGIMACMQLFEMWQWWESSRASSIGSVLAVETLRGEENWNDAYKVFMYTLMLDKFTMAALLACVGICLDEGRQRRFLLVLAVLKFYEYTVVWQWQGYNDETKFTNLDMIKSMALAYSILAGIGWFTPNIPLGTSNNNNNNKSTSVAAKDGPKIKAV